MSRHVRRAEIDAETTPIISQTDFVSYAADMLHSLREMADRQGIETMSGLLSRAEMEAARIRNAQ